MVKCKHHIKATCPHCHHPKEDALHLPTCPHPNVINLWKEALNNLHTWLLNADIHPAIIHFVCSSLTSWTNDPFSEEAPINHLPQNSCQTFKNQLQLGWFTTLSGVLHPSLIQLQQNHYSTITSCCTGSAWGRQLILKLWNIIYELWKLRCNTLHDTIIQQIHGEDQLTFSITVKYHMGAIGLPSQFDGYFTIPLNTLLSKPQSTIKSSGSDLSEMHGKHVITTLLMHAQNDACTKNVMLQNWAHLPTIDL